VDLTSNFTFGISIEELGIGVSQDQNLKAVLDDDMRTPERDGGVLVRYRYKDLKFGDKDTDTEFRKRARGVLESIKNSYTDVKVGKDGSLGKPTVDMAQVPVPAQPIVRAFNEQII